MVMSFTHIRETVQEVLDLIREGATTRCQLWEKNSTLIPLRDDEQLLRAYLQHFFAHDSNYDAFRDTVSDRLLALLFAETKILLGLGDMERWYSLLDDPAAYEALRQRVEISFPPTQPTRHHHST